MGTYTETLLQVMDRDFTLATEQEKQQVIHNLIQMCSVAAGAVTIQPIPFVDSALIIPIQIAMVQGIGRVHGHRLDRKSVVEILSTFGAGIVAQNLAIAAAKFVPFMGWVVTISMAYALTYAIGEVSDFYFRSGRGASPDSLREMFKKVYKAKKAEKESAHKGNASLKDRLEQLKEAHASGLLTQEEFAAKKEALLKSF
jgi:uncharacterized protein (DUF697 family)